MNRSLPFIKMSTSEDNEKKSVENGTFDSGDLDDKDEALKLVGLERADVFTDEDYRRVRRKLASTP